jgi:hypothetical protein
MRIKTIAAIAALALAGVPAGALAAKPAHPATPANTNANSNANGATSTTTTTTTEAPASHGKSGNARVMFVMHGTVTSYTGGSALGMTLTSVNRDRAALTAGTALAFALDPETKVVLNGGASVVNGDKVVVKIRAAKSASASTLSTTPVFQIVDQGAGH